ncbi:hypothetical protein ACFYPB_41810 [Streptomyces olivaceoviridis]|uniref:hypothetical protein n=1 Tax=Streptomyces olivaceoviridis TaxID=1921 RepID=UPI0036B19685
MANLVRWTCHRLGIGPGSRIGLFVGTTFDAHLKELWEALSAGATLLVAPEGSRGSTAEPSSGGRSRASPTACCPPRSPNSPPLAVARLVALLESTHPIRIKATKVMCQPDLAALAALVATCRAEACTQLSCPIGKATRNAPGRGRVLGAGSARCGRGGYGSRNMGAVYSPNERLPAVW